METRSRARRTENFLEALQSQSYEESDNDEESSDSELDYEEELEDFDEDNPNETEDAACDDDLASVGAERMKRVRTSKTASSGTRSKFIYGKNHYKWSLEPLRQRSRSRSQQVYDQQQYGPCGVGDGASVTSAGAAWSILLPDETLEKIVVHTNEAMAKKRTNYTSNPTFTHDIDLIELKAFIGLLYFSGLQGSTRCSTETLYNKLSSPIFRATMPCQRFRFILSALRFDDKTTRHERRETDKLAPIREVWDTFIGNSKKNYNPGYNVTIDEQLLSFRGRCSFRVYIRNKLDKYGLKILTINDSETTYLFDAIPYVGRVATDNDENAPSHYVQELSKSIVGSNRNITCDNSFTSIPLIEKLKNEASLTLVGTIRKNKREIPETMKTISEVGGSKFAFTNNITLVSYSPKQNKVVFVASSMHNDRKISADHQKPEIILYYNKTKGATDTFDQMCHEYTVTRGSRRWPVRFFYGILDQSSINAAILFSLNEENNVISRRKFNENLAYSLVLPFLHRRLTVQTLRIKIRAAIEMVLGIDWSTEQDIDVIDFTMDNPKRCAFCPRNKDRKTKYICAKCHMPRCQDHRSMQCTSCAPNIQNNY